MSYRILDVVPDTPEWFEKRREGLGASDTAAVLGLSKWATPLSVYNSKMGVEREFDPLRAWVGHEQERTIGNWIEKFHPEVGRLLPGFAAQWTENDWLFATPDAVADDQGILIPVEKKTSHEFNRSEWENGVPFHYAVQCQQQVAVLNAPYGWMAVFHGGFDFELFKVPRDDDFIDNHLVPKTRDFWWHHVKALVAPDPSTSTEAVELWPGDPELSIEGGEDLYDLWAAYGLMQAELIEVTETLERTKLELQKAMQDATVLTYEGKELFTWRPRKGSTRLDADALKKDHPDIHAAYLKTSPPTRTFIRKKVEDK